MILGETTVLSQGGGRRMKMEIVRPRTTGKKPTSKELTAFCVLVILDPVVLPGVHELLSGPKVVVEVQYSM